MKDDSRGRAIPRGPGGRARASRGIGDERRVSRRLPEPGRRSSRPGTDPTGGSGAGLRCVLPRRSSAGASRRLGSSKREFLPCGRESVPGSSWGPEPISQISRGGASLLWPAYNADESSHEPSAHRHDVTPGRPALLPFASRISRPDFCDEALAILRHASDGARRRVGAFVASAPENHLHQNRDKVET